MKFLIFIPCFTNGGAEKQATILANYLKENGNYVEVWGFPTLGKDAPLFEPLTSAGILCRKLSRWPSFGKMYDDVGASPLTTASHSVLRFLRNIKLCSELPHEYFDYVIPFTPSPCYLSILCRKRLGGRVFWNHRGGYEVSGGFKYSQCITKQVKRDAFKFIANSKDGARFLSEKFGLDLSEITVIPNVFTPDKSWQILPCFERHSRHNGQPLKLLHLANLFRNKDIWTVLDAMKIIKTKGQHVILNVAGFFRFPEDESRFLYEINNKDLSQLVNYLGPVGRFDLEQLLIDSDVGISSSLFEGVSNTVLEYMYAGLPVIGTDIPGIRDVLPVDNQRWLFPVGDSLKLASLISDLAESEELRLYSGSANRSHVNKAFSLQAAMSEWQHVLEIDQEVG